jgi:hypothetical protein
MTLPKPVHTALIIVLTYVLLVLLMRCRRDGMDWSPALLIGLLATPPVPARGVEHGEEDLDYHRRRQEALARLRP